MVRRIQVLFESRLIHKPIISNTILETGTVFNIIKSDVTGEHGELIGEIEDEGKANEFIKILKKSGAKVTEIEALIKQEDSCVDCGLCVSLCPTGAIYFDEEQKVKYDLKKCIACRACVRNCPVKAVKYLGE